MIGSEAEYKVYRHHIYCTRHTYQQITDYLSSVGIQYELLTNKVGVSNYLYVDVNKPQFDAICNAFPNTRKRYNWVHILYPNK